MPDRFARTASQVAVHQDERAAALAETVHAFLLPTGEAAMFRGQKGPTTAEMDRGHGLAQTILVVEAVPEAAVIWTKPDDLQIDPKNVLRGLRGSRDGGFLAAFADGHVQLLHDDIDPATLRSLFNPRDPNPIDEDKLRDGSR